MGAHGLPVRLPHVHRDRGDPRPLRRVERGEVAGQTERLPVLCHMQNSPAVQIRHDTHILMAREETLLVDVNS